MKNFKKVLALVLAVVMLLSFATVASAASSASYKDVEDIDNVEAVDVLSAIGILDGFNDKTFKPDNILTRAQAAKIIAMFDNKSLNIDKIYASANPFTDCVGNWAESFIAYCYKTGIIDGVGNLKFAPNSKLTGVQFLKMALVVLGYDAKAEGLTGKNWDVNTLALAKRVGLTAGFGKGYDFKSEMSRQEAAQVMLNALRADVVEYGSKLGWNTGIDWENLEGPVDLNGKFYWSVTGAVSTGDKLGDAWGLEESYTTDAFYRPYRTWLLDGEEVGRYMFPVEAEFHTAYNACDLLVELGVAKSSSKAIDVAAHFVNGESVDTMVGEHSHDVIEDSDCSEKNTVSGNQGTLTQVFAISEKIATEIFNDDYDDGGYYVVEIQTWLGKVTDVDKTTTNKDGHLVTSYTSTISQYAGTDIHGDTCLNDITITSTTAGLTKGDAVLFNYSFRNKMDGAYYIELAESKTGRFNGYKQSNYPHMTAIDGEYTPDSYHFHLGYNDSKDPAKFGTKTFYFDHFGNVIGMTDEATATSYRVIDKMWVEFNKGDASLHANIVDIEAKTSTDVVLASVRGHDVNWFLDHNFISDWLNDELAWSLSEVFKNQYNNLFDATEKYALTDTDTLDVTDISIDADKAKMSVDGDTYYADKDTKFLIHENDGTYTAVTGIDKMDSISATNAQIVAADNKVAEVVYLYGVINRKGDSFVAYVGQNSKIWVGEDYVYFKVFVNGVETTLAYEPTKAEWATGINIFELFGGVNCFYNFQYIHVGEKNIVAKPAAITDTDSPYYATAAVTDYANGTLEVDGEFIRIADKVVVYEITVGGSIDVVEFDYDEIVGHDCYVIYDAAGKIATIYVCDTIVD